MLTEQLYLSLFKKSEEGKKVLEDLSARFYDIDGYVKGDPYASVYAEGQRSVIRFILRRMAYVKPSDTQGE